MVAAGRRERTAVRLPNDHAPIPWEHSTIRRCEPEDSRALRARRGRDDRPQNFFRAGQRVVRRVRRTPRLVGHAIIGRRIGHHLDVRARAKRARRDGHVHEDVIIEIRRITHC